MTGQLTENKPVRQREIIKDESSCDLLKPLDLDAYLAIAGGGA